MKLSESIVQLESLISTFGLSTNKYRIDTGNCFSHTADELWANS